MPENKRCWACTRTLVGESKFGLCPDCVNKYGSPVAAVLALGTGVGIKQIIKNREKIIKTITKTIHH